MESNDQATRPTDGGTSAGPLRGKGRDVNIRSISELIGEFRKEMGKTRASLPEAISKAWAEMLGERQAGQTELLGIQKRVLVVKVCSAPLLQELNNYKKNALLQKLTSVKTTDKNKIRDIKFLPG